MNRRSPSGQFLQFEAGEARASRYARVSIVLTAAEGPDQLARCLEYVRPHRERLDAELVVVTRDDPETLADLAWDARLIAAPADAGIGDMRELGMRHASGDVVVVRADIDVGDASWLLELYAITGVALPPATEPVVRRRDERVAARAAVGGVRPRPVIPGLADIGPVEPSPVVAPWEHVQAAPPA